ncbi:MAG: hypothetical protein JJT89_02265 [Nitriliruptoraceae bacterium]|nr:hypothetical protein [Nitriliruptoraceae bacterium]
MPATIRTVGRPQRTRPRAGRPTTLLVVAAISLTLAACSSASSTPCREYLSLSAADQSDLIRTAARQRNRLLISPVDQVANSVRFECEVAPQSDVGTAMERLGIPDSSSPLDRDRPLFWILVLGALGVGAIWRRMSGDGDGTAAAGGAGSATWQATQANTSSAPVAAPPSEERPLDVADRSLLAQARELDEPAPSILELVLRKDAYHRRLSVPQLARELRRGDTQVADAVERLAEQRLVWVGEDGLVRKGSG